MAWPFKKPDTVEQDRMNFDSSMLQRVIESNATLKALPLVESVPKAISILGSSGRWQTTPPDATYKTKLATSYITARDATFKPSKLQSFVTGAKALPKALVTEAITSQELESAAYPVLTEIAKPVAVVMKVAGRGLMKTDKTNILLEGEVGKWLYTVGDTMETAGRDTVEQRLGAQAGALIRDFAFTLPFLAAKVNPLINPILKGLAPIIEKTGMAGTRLLPSMIRSGQFGGALGLTNEAIQQLDEGKFNAKQMAVAWAKGMGEFTVFGAVQASDIGGKAAKAVQAIAYPAIAAYTSAIDSYAKTGKIDWKDLSFNTILMAATFSIHAGRNIENLRTEAANSMKRAIDYRVEQTFKLAAEQPGVDLGINGLGQKFSPTPEQINLAKQTAYSYAFRSMGKVPQDYMPTTGDYEKAAISFKNDYNAYFKSNFGITIKEPEDVAFRDFLNKTASMFAAVKERVVSTTQDIGNEMATSINKAANGHVGLTTEIVSDSPEKAFLKQTPFVKQGLVPQDVLDKPLGQPEKDAINELSSAIKNYAPGNLNSEIALKNAYAKTWIIADPQSEGGISGWRKTEGGISPIVSYESTEKRGTHPDLNFNITELKAFLANPAPEPRVIRPNIMKYTPPTVEDVFGRTGPSMYKDPDFLELAQSVQNADNKEQWMAEVSQTGDNRPDIAKTADLWVQHLSPDAPERTKILGDIYDHAKSNTIPTIPQDIVNTAWDEIGTRPAITPEQYTQKLNEIKQTRATTLASLPNTKEQQKEFEKKNIQTQRTKNQWDLEQTKKNIENTFLIKQPEGTPASGVVGIKKGELIPRTIVETPVSSIARVPDTTIQHFINTRNALLEYDLAVSTKAPAPAKGTNIVMDRNIVLRQQERDNLSKAATNALKDIGVTDPGSVQELLTFDIPPVFGKANKGLSVIEQAQKESDVQHSYDLNRLKEQISSYDNQELVALLPAEVQDQALANLTVEPGKETKLDLPEILNDPAVEVYNERIIAKTQPTGQPILPPVTGETPAVPSQPAVPAEPITPMSRQDQIIAGDKVAKALKAAVESAKKEAAKKGGSALQIFNEKAGIIQYQFASYPGTDTVNPQVWRRGLGGATSIADFYKRSLPVDIQKSPAIEKELHVFGLSGLNDRIKVEDHTYRAPTPLNSAGAYGEIKKLLENPQRNITDPGPLARQLVIKLSARTGVHNIYMRDKKETNLSDLFREFVDNSPNHQEAKSALDSAFDAIQLGGIGEINSTINPILNKVGFESVVNKGILLINEIGSAQQGEHFRRDPGLRPTKAPLSEILTSISPASLIQDAPTPGSPLESQQAAAANDAIVMLTDHPNDAVYSKTRQLLFGEAAKDAYIQDLINGTDQFHGETIATMKQRMESDENFNDELRKVGKELNPTRPGELVTATVSKYGTDTTLVDGFTFNVDHPATNTGTFNTDGDPQYLIEFSDKVLKPVYVSASDLKHVIDLVPDSKFFIYEDAPDIGSERGLIVTDKAGNKMGYVHSDENLVATTQSKPEEIKVDLSSVAIKKDQYYAQQVTGENIKKLYFKVPAEIKPSPVDAALNALDLYAQEKKTGKVFEYSIFTNKTKLGIPLLDENGKQVMFVAKDLPSLQTRLRESMASKRDPNLTTVDPDKERRWRDRVEPKGPDEINTDKYDQKKTAEEKLPQLKGVGIIKPNGSTIFTTGEPLEAQLTGLPEKTVLYDHDVTNDAAREAELHKTDPNNRIVYAIPNPGGYQSEAALAPPNAGWPTVHVGMDNTQPTNLYGSIKIYPNTNFIKAEGIANKQLKSGSKWGPSADRAKIFEKNTLPDGATLPPKKSAGVTMQDFYYDATELKKLVALAERNAERESLKDISGDTFESAPLKDPNITQEERDKVIAEIRSNNDYAERSKIHVYVNPTTGILNAYYQESGSHIEHYYKLHNINILPEKEPVQLPTSDTEPETLDLYVNYDKGPKAITEQQELQQSKRNAFDNNKSLIVVSNPNDAVELNNGKLVIVEVKPSDLNLIQADVTIDQIKTITNNNSIGFRSPMDLHYIDKSKVKPVAINIPKYDYETPSHNKPAYIVGGVYSDESGQPIICTEARTFTWEEQHNNIITNEYPGGTQDFLSGSGAPKPDDRFHQDLNFYRFKPIQGQDIFSRVIIPWEKDLESQAKQIATAIILSEPIRRGRPEGGTFTKGEGDIFEKIKKTVNQKLPDLPDKCALKTPVSEVERTAIADEIIKQKTGETGHIEDKWKALAAEVSRAKVVIFNVSDGKITTVKTWAVNPSSSPTNPPMEMTGEDSDGIIIKNEKILNAAIRDLRDREDRSNATYHKGKDTGRSWNIVQNGMTTYTFQPGPAQRNLITNSVVLREILNYMDDPRFITATSPLLTTVDKSTGLRVRAFNNNAIANGIDNFAKTFEIYINKTKGKFQSISDRYREVLRQKPEAATEFFNAMVAYNPKEASTLGEATGGYIKKEGYEMLTPDGIATAQAFEQANLLRGKQSSRGSYGAQEGDLFRVFNSRDIGIKNTNEYGPMTPGSEVQPFVGKTNEDVTMHLLYLPGGRQQHEIEQQIQTGIDKETQRQRDFVQGEGTLQPFDENMGTEGAKAEEEIKALKRIRKDYEVGGRLSRNDVVNANHQAISNTISNLVTDKYKTRGWDDNVEKLTKAIEAILRVSNHATIALPDNKLFIVWAPNTVGGLKLKDAEFDLLSIRQEAVRYFPRGYNKKDGALSLISQPYNKATNANPFAMYFNRAPFIGYPNDYATLVKAAGKVLAPLGRMAEMVEGKETQVNTYLGILLKHAVDMPNVMQPKETFIEDAKQLLNRASRANKIDLDNMYPELIKNRAHFSSIRNDSDVSLEQRKKFDQIIDTIDYTTGQKTVTEIQSLVKEVNRAVNNMDDISWKFVDTKFRNIWSWMMLDPDTRVQVLKDHPEEFGTILFEVQKLDPMKLNVLRAVLDPHIMPPEKLGTFPDDGKVPFTDPRWNQKTFTRLVSDPDFPKWFKQATTLLDELESKTPLETAGRDVITPTSELESRLSGYESVIPPTPITAGGFDKRGPDVLRSDLLNLYTTRIKGVLHVIDPGNTTGVYNYSRKSSAMLNDLLYTARILKGQPTNMDAKTIGRLNANAFRSAEQLTTKAGFKELVRTNLSTGFVEYIVEHGASIDTALAALKQGKKFSGSLPLVEPLVLSKTLGDSFLTMMQQETEAFFPQAITPEDKTKLPLLTKRYAQAYNEIISTTQGKGMIAREVATFMIEHPAVARVYGISSDPRNPKNTYGEVLKQSQRLIGKILIALALAIKKMLEGDNGTNNSQS